MGVERAVRAATASPPLATLPADFVIVGTNHRHARIEVRERLAGGAPLHRFSATAETCARMTEHLLLSTCNRIEIWFLGTLRDPARLRDELASSLDEEPESFYVRAGGAAMEHAIRVSSGMDSMAWGEPQIGAQVLEALASAEANGWTRGGLPDLVRKVSAAAAHARRVAQVPWNCGSAGDAAVNLILSRFTDRIPEVLIIGTGKMGRLAARRLASSSHLTIADRVPAKAEALARALGASALSLSESADRLGKFDAAIVATAAPRAVLSVERVSGAVRGRTTPVLIVDLSVPRNVDPEGSSVAAIELVNLDDLEPWATPPPADVIEHGEDAIRSEASRLTAWYRSRTADDTVASLRERAEAIRREELSAASRRIRDLSPEARAVIEKMTERIVNRLLHDPTQALRTAAANGEASQEYERLVRELFGLGGDAD